MEARRALKARWVITADLKLKTAAQIGSHEADNCDQTFARDEQGYPMLQGTTLAGALRSALCDFLGGYRATEPSKEVGSLFGHLDMHESPLIFFDSVASEKGDASLRDGVRIEPVSGLAEDGFKYDREVCLSGVVFPFRCDLLIPADEAGRPDEDTLLSYLLVVLQKLADSSLRLGARRSRGQGEVQATAFRAVRYDLTTLTDWVAYANSNYGNQPLAGKPACDDPQVTLTTAFPAFNPAPLDDKRRQLKLKFELELDSTLLIRSPGRKSEDADTVHLTEQGKAILSGTSVAGAFRAQASRILNTLGVAESTSRIEALFGTAPRSKGAAKRALVGSRIRFSEAQIRDYRVYRQPRVKIDRFTGGTIDTALFDEQPVVGGKVVFDAEIRNPEPAEIALLLLAARDLLDGLLTLGGGASVGRGRMCGSIQAILPDGEGLVTFDRNGVSSDIDLLQPFLDALTAQGESTHA